MVLVPPCDVADLETNFYLIFYVTMKNHYKSSFSRNGTEQYLVAQDMHATIDWKEM